MTDKLKTWAAFAVAASSLLAYVAQLLECAAEHEKMQGAVQALAELALQ